MGPLAHIGITLSAGYVLNRAPLIKLNLWVVAVSALLPDLVDKPLFLLGIGNGRYVAHTLLFVFLVAAAVSLKSKVYGLSVLLGGIFHLLLDSGGSVPWLYPFVHHAFTVDFDPGGIPDRLSRQFEVLEESWHGTFDLAAEIMGLIVVLGLLCYLSLRYFRAKRAK